MTTTLTEVKKGQTGSGLLIENDGFISLDIKGNELIKEALAVPERLSTKELPRPFIVSAVFQKYGIENANGRIYPEAILKREVERYQQVINDRRAYGECYTPDAECMTPDGWKLLKDMKVGDEVLAMNEITMAVEYQAVEKVIELDYNGDIYRVKGDFVDDTLTPNHKYSVYEFHNTYKFKCSATIEELASGMYNDCYIITSKNCVMGIGINTLKFTREHYEGKVNCIEVPFHTFYVKQNGKSHWTRNCNHPEQSSIDLGRIAMNIIELHWEGHTLVGKMEIPITEGFRNMGIVSCFADMVAQWIVSGLRIGVSSRALGSVERDMSGKLIVQDDLSLVCWDVVGEPSTPSAYIELTDDRLKPYVENTDHKGDVIVEDKNNDKLSKFKKWLND